MPNSFRQRLAAGERLVGTIVTCTAPSVAELLALAGFDWLFIDAEHGPFDTADLQAVLQAVAGRAACIVRVPAGDEHFIKRTLDLGADGIIVPQVNSAQQAEQVVKYARYSPQGARGVGLARAHGYGLQFAEYVDGANDHVTVIVQAEHIEAVRHIDGIATVEGVDAVLLGPYDLSASLGKLGQLDDREVVAAIDKVVETCQEAKMPLGYFGLTADAIRPFAQRGCQLLVASVDMIHLAGAATQLLKEVRDL